MRGVLRPGRRRLLLQMSGPHSGPLLPRHTLPECQLGCRPCFQRHSLRLRESCAANPQMEPLWAACIIFLDTYMPYTVYTRDGFRLRNHCRAQPPRHPEPSRLVATVGWRDRAATPHAATGRLQASESVARGRFRGINGGRTAPPLPVEARTFSRARYVAGAVPPLLVRSRRCSRTPPRSHG